MLIELLDLVTVPEEFETVADSIASMYSRQMGSVSELKLGLLKKETHCSGCARRDPLLCTQISITSRLKQATTTRAWIPNSGAERRVDEMSSDVKEVDCG